MTDLIPRKHLFGNPSRIGFRLSPDGRKLGWIAPVAGVLNVWVGPVDDADAGMPVTDDTRRGITHFAWALDGRHLLYVQDADGDENNHVYAVDVATRDRRDLTPIPGVAAGIAALSRRDRDHVLVALNDRDPRFHDLHSVAIADGTRRLVQENPGFAGFTVDEDYRVRLAARPHPGGSTEILRRSGADWETLLTFSYEDARVSRAENVDAAGEAVFCRDSRGRDTAALTRVEIATGARTVIAAHDDAEISAVLRDRDSHEPIAYAVTRERQRWHAIDPRLGDDIAFLDAQGIGDWSLASRSEDDRLWILSCDSDLQP